MVPRYDAGRPPVVALALALVAAVAGVRASVNVGKVDLKRQDLRFIDKFCFDETGGFLYISATPGAGVGAEQWILFYADMEDQWLSVYNGDLTCDEKKNRSALALGVSTLHVDPNEPSASLRVTGNRPRWWYVALANCETGIVSLTNLELQFNNKGDGIFRKQFSADQRNIYPLVLCFYCISLIFLIGLYWSKRLAKLRKRHHEALKSVLWAVWFENLSLLFQLFHYGTFARDGVGFSTLLDWAFFWDLFSTLCLLQVILDISKGWGISTTHRSARLTGLGLVGYAIAQAGVFLWGVLAVDPAQVVYIFESWAGGVLIAFRMVLMFYFVYNCVTSYGHERDHPRADPLKMRFYRVFGVYGTCWFLVLPLTVLVAHFVRAWVRALVVSAFTFSWTWVFFGGIWYIFFPSLHTTTPSAADGERPVAQTNGPPGSGQLPSITGGLVMDPNASRAFGGNTMQIFPELPMSSI